MRSRVLGIGALVLSALGLVVMILYLPVGAQPAESTPTDSAYADLWSVEVPEPYGVGDYYLESAQNRQGDESPEERNAPEGVQFLRLPLLIANTTDAPTDADPYEGLLLEDSQGKTYKHFVVHLDPARDRPRNPDVPTLGVLIYEVPKGVQPVAVVSTDGSLRVPLDDLATPALASPTA